jgi:peptidoglycan/LPS O-acetylase OafA/YrhL
MKIFQNWQRTTTSTHYIPAIDGLRFFAIAAVVLFHIENLLYMDKRVIVYSLFGKKILHQFLNLGSFGVQLFFMISGFMLILPFASAHLEQKPLPILRKYYLRRLTRLSPPYLLLSIILFALPVAMHKIAWTEVALPFLATITYTNTVFFPESLPLYNPVTWSLEVEMQFYLVLPVLAIIFRISPQYRRVLLLASILLLTFAESYFGRSFLLIVNYLPYFLLGFLLADFYLFRPVFYISNKIMGLGILSFIWLFWHVHAQETAFYFMISTKINLLFCCFTVGYIALFHSFWQRIFSFKPFTIIGGMCYSIYLLHAVIISISGKRILGILNFSPYYILNFFIYTVFFVLVIAFFSVLYFKMIEQPCMQNDWYKFKNIDKRSK